MTRLFVAAFPPPELAERLVRAAGTGEDGVRAMPADQLHVTLRFIGDADADAVVARLEQMELATATARLGPAIVRLGGRQLVAPAAGADRVAAAVRAATDGLGEADRHPFFGHLTLARTRRGSVSRLEGASVGGSFRLDDIRLVASRLEPTGSVYATIATVPAD